MYIAAVLDTNSIQRLKVAIQSDWKLVRKMTFDEEFPDFLYQTEAGMSLPHHMTVNLGILDVKLNDPRIIGKPVKMVCEKMVFNPTLGICAVRVARAFVQVELHQPWLDLKSTNKISHITVCLKKGVKPRISNDLLEKTHEDTSSMIFTVQLYLDAIIEEVQ